MNMNETTTSSEATGPSAGLAVGLTFFFVGLLLFIVAGVVVYKFRGAIRDKFQLEPRRSQKTNNHTEAPDAESHYHSLTTEQPGGPNSIYENLNTKTAGQNRRAAKETRYPTEPEEDLYLACDLQDDAIYSNDPACNLSIDTSPLHCQEDDVYIMPESL